MSDPGSTERQPPAAPRVRAAVWYALEGDLRYLSHHDEIRMLARALRRAAWPLRFSEGFNPAPQFTLPLPRPVGTASRAQVALVELDQDHAARDLFERLAPALPPPARLLRVAAPFSARTLHAVASGYDVTLDPQDADGLTPRIEQLMSLRECVVPRQRGREERPASIDIRPYLRALELVEGVLRMTVSYEQQRTARPTEVLLALGLSADAYAHRVLRTQVLWDTDWARWPAWPESEE